ncbi:retrotransposon protein, putative, ty1-copia subclass [Tanacetum coccineum]
MKIYIDQLERLVHPVTLNLGVSLILVRLYKEYDSFVQNYNMHSMGKTVNELHVMLKLHEETLPKKFVALALHAIRARKVHKNKNKKPSKASKGVHGKGKGKMAYANAAPSYAPKPKNPCTKRAKHNLDSTYLWHCCLAHIIDDKEIGFLHRPERATDLLEYTTDVCGPLRHVSRQGASYFITFIDDYSRYGYVYPLKHKHELTPPYTPQHNGVSERRNRTLLDMVRSMMNLTTLPLSFWDYALESATRILNMVPTNKVDKTPYELWYGKVPNLSYLKVWGCEVLVKRDTPDKLQHRSVKCIFIGYLKEIMGYYFYFPPENKIVVASEIPIEVEGFEPPQEEVIPVRRSKRTHQAPSLCSKCSAEGA